MMYGYGYDGWSVWVWIIMGTMMLLFWAAVATLLVFLVRDARGGRRTSAPASPPHDDPERILAQRFARGEIDEADYTARLDALQRP